MICQPPEDWTRRKSFSNLAYDDNNGSIELNQAENEKLQATEKESEKHYIHWKQALRMKEFYLLWITRLSVVLITQVLLTESI